MVPGVAGVFVVVALVGAVCDPGFAVEKGSGVGVGTTDESMVDEFTFELESVSGVGDDSAVGLGIGELAKLGAGDGVGLTSALPK